MLSLGESGGDDDGDTSSWPVEDEEGVSLTSPPSIFSVVSSFAVGSDEIDSVSFFELSVEGPERGTSLIGTNVSVLSPEPEEGDLVAASVLSPEPEEGDFAVSVLSPEPEEDDLVAFASVSFSIY